MKFAAKAVLYKDSMGPDYIGIVEITKETLERFNELSRIVVDNNIALAFVQHDFEVLENAPDTIREQVEKESYVVLTPELETIISSFVEKYDYDFPWMNVELTRMGSYGDDLQSATILFDGSTDSGSHIEIEIPYKFLFNHLFK